MKIYLLFCKFFSNSENMLSWFGLSAHTLRVNSSDVWLGACFVCFIYSSSWNLSSVLLSYLSLSCDCQRVLSGKLMVRFCNRRETLLVSHLGILLEFKPMEDKGKIKEFSLYSWNGRHFLDTFSHNPISFRIIRLPRRSGDSTGQINQRLTCPRNLIFTRNCNFSLITLMLC